MAIPPPPLDDRDYAQLLADARSFALERCPEWTDMTPGDPGEVLLELFAYLTDALLYRLNRLPERLYVAFLNLIGVSLEPPSAASVTLTFSAPAADVVRRVPRGTRVGIAGSPRPEFTTVADAELPAGRASVDVPALACDQIAGELLGTGTGAPGQAVRLVAPPVIARVNRADQPDDARDLAIGVAAGPGERADLIHAAVGYCLWREVSTFADAEPEATVYVADRVAGTITFGPPVRDAADGSQRSLGAAPPTGRQIRAWYRRGGGAAGNIASGVLTRLVDPLPAFTVTNAGPAVGGRDAESVAEALIRGPAQLFSLQRAVTVGDFELAARRATGGVARAKAITQTEVWAHGTPGTVEIVLVPQPAEGHAVAASALGQLETPDTLERVRLDLDRRRPIGTRCEVSWAHYKTVSVRARLVLHPAADPDDARQRVLHRLGAVINPVDSGPDQRGWPFGQPLRVSDVYAAVLTEPSVRYVEEVSLAVDDVPDSDVSQLVADPFQPHTWLCGARDTVFRSMDDGEGWESAGRFPDETINVVITAPQRAGVVVVACRLGTAARSRLRASFDAGESWVVVAAETGFLINDLTVVQRDGQLVLLIATDQGLFECPLAAEQSVTQVLVDPASQGLGFYAITQLVSDQGDVSVALAAREQRGVFMSDSAGRPGTFRLIGLTGEDVRVLVVRRHGPRRLLLAGITVESGSDAGKGVQVLEIQGRELSPSGWQLLGNDWNGGSCRDLTVVGDTMLAASHRMGVLRLDLRAGDAKWQPPSVDSGLPLRDTPSGQVGRFEPVMTVAARAGAEVVLAAGARGVRCSADAGTTYRPSSERVFRDRVTLPATWLFCSGEHRIEVDSARI